MKSDYQHDTSLGQRKTQSPRQDFFSFFFSFAPHLCHLDQFTIHIPLLRLKFTIFVHLSLLSVLVFGVFVDFKGRSFFSVNNPAVILETVKMVRTKSNQATISCNLDGLKTKYRVRGQTSKREWTRMVDLMACRYAEP